MKIPNCTACGKPLTSNEFDTESGTFFSQHSLVCPDSDTEFFQQALREYREINGDDRPFDEMQASTMSAILKRAQQIKATIQNAADNYRGEL